ncbi:MAG: hypothetical protein ACKO96_38780, partial [Flammeovirgaceae bacterium]
MAMLHEPKMILLDEPFTGLTPQNISFLTESIRDLNFKSGVSLLIIEHRIKECLALVNRLISLKFGKVFNEFQIKGTFDIDKLQTVFV